MIMPPDVAVTGLTELAVRASVVLAAVAALTVWRRWRGPGRRVR
jgi:hypothetical protein